MDLSGGGSSKIPYEAPDNLESAQKLKVVDILCEGPIGSDVSLQNILLNGTPIQNKDNSYNFRGIEVSYLAGQHDQSPLKGFEQTSKVKTVGLEVKHNKPITRTISDELVDSIRLVLSVSSLMEITDDGDRLETTVDLIVQVGDKQYPVHFDGKTTTSYNQDLFIDDLPPVPFNITVSRATPDSTSEKIRNNTFWNLYVENTDSKFTYPDTVVVGLAIDSQQFGGQIPTRSYLTDWQVVQVPSNYDPKTRMYDGFWDGSFKYAWTDNPAWILYDVVTHKRYGLGERVGSSCDKWALYEIAQYCDEIVDDGFGGKEPRFTCNLYLKDQIEARKLLDNLCSCFRGIPIWNGTELTFAIDSKKDPIAIFTNANVVDGLFEYTSSELKTIYTAAHVQYIDKDNGYKTTTEYIADDKAIARYGLNVKQFTAFGCTSRGQAARAGKWMIETSIRERQTVSFKTGMQGLCLLPWDIIEIADGDYAGDKIYGRIVSVINNTVEIDSLLDIDCIGSSFHYMVDNSMHRAIITKVEGKTLTLDTNLDENLNLSVFAIAKDKIKPRLFRVVGIKEDNGVYTVNAITHDPHKEQAVDKGMVFAREKQNTLHKTNIFAPVVTNKSDGISIAWQGIDAKDYLIKLYRDEKLYIEKKHQTPQVDFNNLPNGHYRSVIQAVSIDGLLSEPLIKEWDINYDIQGLIASPELFAIKLNWTNPTLIMTKANVEIWHSKTNNQKQAKLVATLPLPTHSFEQNGIKLSETHHFWLRIKDNLGNYGEFSYISGECSDDTSAIVESLNGKITKSELGQSLIDSLQNDIEVAFDKTNKSFASKLAVETAQRQQALLVQEQKQSEKLLVKAKELGVKITNVEKVANNQSQQLSRLTATNNNLVAGLEVERQARIKGDNAEAQARANLVSQVEKNTAGISTLSQTVTNNQQSMASQLTSLTAKINTKPKRYDWSNGIQFWGKSISCEFPPSNAHIVYIKFRATDVEGGLHIKLNGVEKSIGLKGKNEEDKWYSIKVDSDINRNKPNIVVLENPEKTDGGLIYSVVWAEDDMTVSSIKTLSKAVVNNSNSITKQLNELTAKVEKASSSSFLFKNANKLNQEWSYYDDYCKGERSFDSNNNLVIGNNNGSDDAWIIAKKRFTVTPFSIYKITYFLEKQGANGRLYLGCEGYDINGSKHSVRHRNEHSVQFYAYSSIDNFSFDKKEVYILGSKINENNYKGTYYKKLCEHIREISPLVIANYKGTGVVKLNSIEVELVSNNDKAQALHTIKTQAIAGGKKAIAGIAVGAMANEQTAESSVIVMADKFGVVANAQDGNVKPMLSVVKGKVAINGDLIADGTIQGKHISANQTITAPNIKGGRITGNTISGSTISGGVIRGTRLEGVTGKISGKFEVTELAGPSVMEVINCNNYKPTRKIMKYSDEGLLGRNNFYYFEYRAKVSVKSSKVDRMISVSNVDQAGFEIDNFEIRGFTSILFNRNDKNKINNIVVSNRNAYFLLKKNAGIIFSILLKKQVTVPKRQSAGDNDLTDYGWMNYGKNIQENRVITSTMISGSKGITIQAI